MLWPGGNAIGKRLRYAPSSQNTASYREIVGVVGNVQQRELGGAAGLDFYVPYRQGASANQYLLIRTTLSSADFQRQAETALWSIDPEQSAFDFQSYDQRIQDSIWQVRLSRVLLLLLSITALALAAVGVYGAISFIVSAKNREIGIRLALGATPARIRKTVVAHAIFLAGIGCGIGVLGSISTGQAIRAMLPGNLDLTPWSSLAVSAGVAGLLLLVAVTSSALPAWRASHVAPEQLLRR
jgi:ABC-type antimicrobial peptide transport system permease subunit